MESMTDDQVAHWSLEEFARLESIGWINPLLLECGSIWKYYPLGVP